MSRDPPDCAGTMGCRKLALMAKTPTILDLFTTEELERAAALYESSAPGTFNKAVVKEVVLPVMARINAVVGQENDPSYIGYALEAEFMQTGMKGPGR